MAKIDQLRQAGSYQTFGKGHVIVQDGETGEDMYILLRGTAGVYKDLGKPTQRQVAQLGPGEFFGEMSLFIGKGRTATVIALEDATALRIGKADALDFFRLQPEQTLVLITAICRRLDMAQSRLGEAMPAAPGPFIPPPIPEAPVQAVIAPAITAAAAPPPPMDIGDLFLPGHGTYELPEADLTLIYDKSCQCPQCGHKFSAKAVRQSKLITERTDRDGRKHYKGVEPIHYDIVTCPSCWFSALGENFAKALKRKELVAKQLAPFKAAFGADLPTDAAGSVFLGYYLAIACGALCFQGPHLLLGALWQKLSRLYADCEANELELEAAKRSLESYMNAYTKTDIAPRQNQQLCIIIAELYLKQDQYKEARDFFFKAKTDPVGGATFRRHAEDRIEDIREIRGNGL